MVHSVDKKLATFSFEIRKYKWLLTPIDYNLVYMYLLISDWFNAPKYRDYYEHMIELGCPYSFDYLLLNSTGL